VIGIAGQQVAKQPIATCWRRSLVSGKERTDWQIDNLRSWGTDAVWVDPWQGDGVAFPVDDLVKGKVRNLNAIYKCNTVELVEEGLPISQFHVD
jgi:hypothetical protein